VHSEAGVRKFWISYSCGPRLILPFSTSPTSSRNYLEKIMGGETHAITLCCTTFSEKLLILYLATACHPRKKEPPPFKQVTLVSRYFRLALAVICSSSSLFVHFFDLL
jgi:hypothetical protein